MSNFVDEAMSLARQCELSIVWCIRNDETRSALRTYLEAREAVTQRLAEALRSCWDLGIDKHMVEQVRAALQAYEEANR